MGRHPPGPRDRAFGFRLASQMRQAPLEVFPQWGRQYGDLTHIRVAWLRIPRKSAIQSAGKLVHGHFS